MAGRVHSQRRVGVLGDLPPAASLSRFVGAQIQRASAKYNYLQSLDEMSPCHLLFVSGKDEAAKQRVRETASRLGKKPVVIVCEVDGGLEDGAMISFVLVGDRIKFDVDLSAAKEVGIDFDARMLRIARNVVQ